MESRYESQDPYRHENQGVGSTSRGSDYGERLRRETLAKSDKGWRKESYLSQPKGRG